MAGVNKELTGLLINGGLLVGAGLAAWYGYKENFFGIRDLISSVKNVATTPPSSSQGTGPFQPQYGFEQGLNPNLPSVPAGAPGVDDSESPFYPSQYSGGAVDPVSGIDYSFYPYATGVGTLPGTNPTPYPNPCLPGYYRASDLKCYPIPTQFPGNGCGPGMYLANDGRCYNYPTTGVGAGFPPVPCPVGEYRASDGKCYALPTPPPESCPIGWYRASDGKCYRTNPNDTSAPTCPTGFTLGSDGICRPTNPTQQPPIQCPAGTVLVNGQCVSTQCPAGYQMVNGVCVPTGIVCPAGFHVVNGVCVPDTSPCPAGYTLVNGVCVPAPSGTPANVPLGPLTLIKILGPGQSPSTYCQSCLYRSSMGHIDTDYWKAVKLRPELSGGVTQYAVIIVAEDNGDKQDAMARHNFIPLTADILSRYIETSSHSFATFGRKMRVLNNSRRR